MSSRFGQYSVVLLRWYCLFLYISKNTLTLFANSFGKESRVTEQVYCCEGVTTRSLLSQIGQILPCNVFPHYSQSLVAVAPHQEATSAHPLLYPSLPWGNG